LLVNELVTDLTELCTGSELEGKLGTAAIQLERYLGVLRAKPQMFVLLSLLYASASVTELLTPESGGNFWGGRCLWPLKYPLCQHRSGQDKSLADDLAISVAERIANAWKHPLGMLMVR